MPKHNKNQEQQQQQQPPQAHVPPPQGMDQMTMMSAMMNPMMMHPVMRMQMMQQMPWMGGMGMPPQGASPFEAQDPNQNPALLSMMQQQQMPFNPMTAAMMMQQPYMMGGPPQQQQQQLPSAILGQHPQLPGGILPYNNRGVPTEIITSVQPPVPHQGGGKGKKNKKRDKDKPKRPLSAYNLFFKDERKRILEELDKTKDDSTTVKVKEDGEETTKEGEEDDTKEKETIKEEEGSPTAKNKKTPHGKIGFESLAKLIGKRWQELDSAEVEKYKKLADEDAKRYKVEMEVYLTKEHSSGGDTFGDRIAKKSRVD